MQELRQDPQGLEKRKGEAASHRAAGAEDTGKEASLKREYAWCVVQVSAQQRRGCARRDWCLFAYSSG